MTAFYNEIDPYAAQFLRNLIDAGHIAPGVVDERDIRDIKPEDLNGFTQCHFFAGIGVWSLALRRAGVPDDVAVWTGSCPCQPFSAAGRGGGTADERHLWPHWFHLISVCQPDIVFGEQVASPDGLGWLDLVQADLEREDYTVGALDSCAAGFGAPHIRQRLYFGAAQGLGDGVRTGLERYAGDGDGPAGRALADRPTSAASGAGGLADDERGDGRGEHRNSVDRASRACEEEAGEWKRVRTDPANDCATDGLADADSGQRHGRSEATRGNERDGQDARRAEGDGGPAAYCGDGGVGNPVDKPRQRGTRGISGAQTPVDGARIPEHGPLDQRLEHAGEGVVPQQPSPTNGFWGAADWLGCRDAKWRPVEPGTFPLAHGAPARVGRLRTSGNAIVAPQAQAFIESFLEAIGDYHARN